MDNATRYDRGITKLKQMFPNHAEQTLASLQDVAPDLGRYIAEFVFGDVVSRPGLELKLREIATVAALTAMGTAGPQLRAHMHAALNVGCSEQEIVEIVIQMAVFAGFPAALNGTFAAKEVFAERAGNTNKRDDDRAKSASAEGAQDATNSGTDRYNRGIAKLKIMQGTAGEKTIATIASVSPDLARYALEFVFGDVHSRPGLDMKSREIASVAALTALANAAPQLRAHIHAALTVGCSREEVVEVIIQMAVYAGFPAAINAVHAAKDAFAS